jgi:membrane fusion protein, multidrug efflux system
MTVETPLKNSLKGNLEQRKKLMLLLFAVFLALGLIYGLYWIFFKQFEVSTNNAYVDGNLVQLMPQVSGIVSTILADDTQLVLQGQPIIKLDDADAKNNLQNAEATLASTVRQVRQYYLQAKQLAADLELRKADLIKAENDLKRREKLVKTAAISTEELQNFKTKVTAAKAQYNEAMFQLQAASALVQGTTLEQHPLVLQAEAKLHTTYLEWKRTTLVAPVAGYVAKRSVQLGQQVNPGMPLLVIIPLNQIWVNANFKESQLRYIRVGQPAVVTVDLYGKSLQFQGKVIGIAPGAGSVFSLLPPQNATGNWIKIVQRLPVRISLNPKQLLDHPLRVGLSSEVTVDIKNQTGSALAVAPTSHPLYSTTIYDGLLAQSEALTKKIIHDNS